MSIFRRDKFNINLQSDENEEQYCTIRRLDDNSFDVIPEKDIQVPSNSITLYQLYMVKTRQGRRQGTVVCKGTKQECEMLQYNIVPRPSTTKERERSHNRGRATADDDDSDNESFHTASSTLPIPKQTETNDDNDSNAMKKAVLLKILKVLMEKITDNENDENEEKHNMTCNGCGCSPVRSDRYKCLTCRDDFDLCAGCFERRVEPNEHKSGHIFVHFRLPNELFGRKVTNNDVTFEKLKQFYANDIHESVTCDGCSRVAFVGLRFKCDTCPDYDLCQKCAGAAITTRSHKSTHPLIVTSHRVLAQIPSDDIELGEELGRGAFGSVHKARWISKNRTVACKVITVPDSNRTDTLERSFFKELAAYMELSGGYILKTYGYATSRQRNSRKYMIIMEYMARGSLASVLKSKDEHISLRRKVHIAQQIASGMRKIHEHHMIHRDIRPDNILISQNYTAKIGDMGIARVVDPLNQHTQIGCAPFMPPEFRPGTYDQKLDIFTFGLTLNELFTETRHQFRPFANEKIAFQAESPIFQDLINRCTADDPKHRPAAIEIEKTLELYSQAFDHIVLKKNLGYIRLSTERKNEIFVKFYEKFKPTATEFIRKQFPPEFLNGSTSVAGVRVEKDANNKAPIECPIQ